MPKVKVFAVKDVEFDEYTKSILIEGISDWEEVTEEDAEILRKGLWEIRNDMVKQYGYEYTAMIVFQDTVPARIRIEQIHKMLEKDRKKKEKEDAAKKASAKKREKNKKEKELELLKKLKEKYE